MTAQHNPSQWRIELAQELVIPYTRHPGIRLIVLGGSASRGLSDAYSDLDIIVYWDTIDAQWLETPVLEQRGGQRRYFTPYGDHTLLETYYFDTIKVDLAHITLESWAGQVAAIQERFETTPSIQQAVAGFLDASVLYGEALYLKLKDRLIPYPPQLAYNIIRENMRFFVEGCLLHQGLERGEILFFYDGVSLMLKRVLLVIAAINNVYLSVEEPRWIAYFLSTKMPVHPQQTWERIQTILTGDRHQALVLLYELIYDTLSLVEQHYSDIDVDYVRNRMKALAVHACDTKPTLL